MHLLLENDGSTRRQAQKPLTDAERRTLYLKIHQKYFPDRENARSVSPIFCRSCSQREVAQKNSVCEPCAEKLQNIETKFYHIPVSPGFALLGMITAGFCFFAFMDWLIRAWK